MWDSSSRHKSARCPSLAGSSRLGWACWWRARCSGSRRSLCPACSHAPCLHNRAHVIILLNSHNCAGAGGHVQHSDTPRRLPFPSGSARPPSVTPAAGGGGDTPGAAEPSFQLPPALQEYTGAADDRKALMDFKRRQAVEQKKLDRARWGRGAGRGGGGPEAGRRRCVCVVGCGAQGWCTQYMHTSACE